MSLFTTLILLVKFFKIYICLVIIPPSHLVLAFLLLICVSSQLLNHLKFSSCFYFQCFHRSWRGFFIGSPEGLPAAGSSPLRWWWMSATQRHTKRLFEKIIYSTAAGQRRKQHTDDFTVNYEGCSSTFVIISNIYIFLKKYSALFLQKTTSVKIFSALKKYLFSSLLFL